MAGSGRGFGNIWSGNGGMSSKATGCCEAVTAEAIPRRCLGPRSKRRAGFADFSRQIARGSRRSMTGRTARKRSKTKHTVLLLTMRY